MRNIKSYVNCSRRWKLCRLVGKIHREDDICSGPWRRRFTRRFLVNQEKKRTLYQRSHMHEDAEDMAHVQIWILPLTSWVKSFNLFWSLNILIWKRQLYYFWATHKFMPRLRYPLFLKSVWKWWGWEWLWDRLDGCPTGALQDGEIVHCLSPQWRFGAERTTAGRGDRRFSDDAEKLICFPF